MAGRFPPQQPPAQDLGNAPAATRPSPFASGPVAMVNQVRPGFGAPGQFPGHAVRAAPTQLSTPMVPQRHLSASSTLSEPTPSLFGDRPQTHSDPASDLFGHVAPPPVQSGSDLFGPAPSSSPQRYRSSTDPFGSPSGPAPPFQMQHAHNEIPTEAGRALPEELFGPASAPGQPSQRNSSENLFGSPENPPKISRHSSLSSTESPTLSPFSKSLPPPAQPRPNQQYNSPYQQPQQQQSSSRSFGQAPPPAAPFLGYADNTRSQSFRARAAPASTPGSLSLFSDTRKIPSPARSAFPAGSVVSPPSPPRITIEASSPDELVDEFLKMSVDERFAGTEKADPPASKLLLADVPDTVDGLETLYMQKRWKSLTKKALSMLQNPSKDINVTLEIKSWWLAGLIKEGHYDNASSVLDQIGNLDEIAIAGGGTPFVPIRLLLLQALLSKCQGKSATHEKQLFHLIMRLRSAMQQNKTVTLLGVESQVAAKWLRIAQFSLVNHLVHQQKFMLALRICSQIDVQYLKDEEKVIVLSRVGRIRLQMGDLSAAEKLFEAARNHTSQLREGSCVSAKVMGELEARLLLNDGLLLFAQNKLQEALSAFDSILYLQNTQAPTTEGTDIELFVEEDVVCSAVNNYAICSLYSCDVKGAVAALERMIRSNPQRFLNGVVVFNLSSLYDLLFDNATSKNRKEMMRKIAHLYDLEHVDPAAYRI